MKLELYVQLYSVRYSEDSRAEPGGETQITRAIVLLDTVSSSHERAAILDSSAHVRFTVG